MERLRIKMSGWPSGLRRQTQGNPCTVTVLCKCSGPQMWAWVQIPLLTKDFVDVLYPSAPFA